MTANARVDGTNEVEQSSSTCAEVQPDDANAGSPRARQVSIRTAVGRWLSLLFFGIGLACAAWSQHLCELKQGQAALVYYLVGAVVTALSLVGSRPVVRWASPRERVLSDVPRAGAGTGRRLFRRRALELGLPLLVIVVVASPSLYWRVLEVPPGPMHDEAFSALYALAFSSGQRTAWWAPGQDAQPAVYNAVNGLLFNTFGPTLKTFRIANATWGLITALCLFLYVRRLAGTLIGVVTAILFVQTLWVVNLSRWGYSMSWSMLGAMLACAGIGVALARSEEHIPPSALHPLRWWPYGLVGFGLAFAQYGYVSGRLVIPAVGLTLLIAYMARPDFIRHNWPGLCVMTAVAGIVALPWYWSLQVEPGIFLRRAEGLGIHHDILESRSLQPLWVNLKIHLLLFNYDGDHAPVNNLPGQPLLHFLVAPVVAMGLVISVVQWRALVPMLPALWFGVLIWSGVLSRWTEVPKAHRFLTVAPVLFIAAATWLAQGRRILEAVLTTLGRRAAAVARGVLSVALIVWATAHTALQYDLYFHRYANHPSVYYVFSPIENLLNARMRERQPTVRTILDSEFSTEQMKFLTAFDDWVRFARVQAGPLGDAFPTRGPANVFVQARQRACLDRLAQALGVETRTVNDPRSADAWWVEAHVPDSARARALLAEDPAFCDWVR